MRERVTQGRALSFQVIRADDECLGMVQVDLGPELTEELAPLPHRIDKRPGACLDHIGLCLQQAGGAAPAMSDPATEPAPAGIPSFPQWSTARGAYQVDVLSFELSDLRQPAPGRLRLLRRI
jgi:hypothetical protein